VVRDPPWPARGPIPERLPVHLVPRGRNGRVIFEVYSNPAAAYTEFRSAHPLCFHVAFVADDPGSVRARLVAAGATPAYEETLPDGSFLIMVRDPWGIPLQLVRRVTPFPAS
jgi:glyoxylase I family protein